jgi:AcrR family transcriptional regulator
VAPGDHLILARLRLATARTGPMTTEHPAYPRPDAATARQLSALQLRILDTAAAAFMERGYDATSVAEIARAMGATKGAVYYTYRSKIDLFLGVYERGMLLLEARVARALEHSRGSSAADRLRAVNAGHVENIMENLHYHVVIQQGVEQRRQMPLRDLDRARLTELDAMRNRHELLVRSLIQEGILDGSIRDVPISLAARTLIGGVVGIAIWYRPRGNQTTGERHALANGIVDLLVSGLLPR